jgi:hypothetical protein
MLVCDRESEWRVSAAIMTRFDCLSNWGRRRVAGKAFIHYLLFYLTRMHDLRCFRPLSRKRSTPILCDKISHMNMLSRMPSWIALHWRTSAVIACATVGIVATTRRCLETDEARAQREQRNRKKGLAQSPIRFPSTVAKSTNGTQPGA